MNSEIRNFEETRKNPHANHRHRAISAGELRKYAAAKRDAYSQLKKEKEKREERRRIENVKGKSLGTHNRAEQRTKKKNNEKKENQRR